MKFIIWILFSITIVFRYSVICDDQQRPEECEVGADGTCEPVRSNDSQPVSSKDDIAVDDETTNAIEIDKNCPDRGHIIRCTGKYLDLNRNGKLDRVELDNAISSLPWYARGIVKLLGNTDKMMKKCDMDHDDAISMDFDMLHNQDTCLATCFKRKAFKQTFFSDCKL